MHQNTSRRAALHKLLRTLVVLTSQMSTPRKRNRSTLPRLLGIQQNGECKTGHLSSRKECGGLGDAMGLFGYTGLTMFTRWTLCRFLAIIPESQTSYFHTFLSGYQCSRHNCYLLTLWPVVFGRFVSRLSPVARLQTLGLGTSVFFPLHFTGGSLIVYYIGGLIAKANTDKGFHFHQFCVSPVTIRLSVL